MTKQNWTGIALRFSRNTYKNVRDREEFSKPGVYVLAGDPIAGDDQREIYVGEAGAVRDRLNNHLSNQDFWTEAVVFVASDDFNVSHAKYLEAKLLRLAKTARRATVRNSQPMAGPALGEADAADMETFLAEMLVVYPILGISAFEAPRKKTEERLILTGSGADARGQRTDEGFLVFAGATGRTEVVPSAEGYGKMITLRSELKAQGVLNENGDVLRLTQDRVFGSPSLAASMFMGRTANGRTEWKTGDGRTLKELEDAEAQSEPSA